MKPNTHPAQPNPIQPFALPGALPELTAASLTSQLAAGLYYLHQHKVIHRDLKPANLLLGREKKKRQRRAEGASEAGEEDCSSGRIIVKISDFGVSADVRGEELAKRSCVGTPWYLVAICIFKNMYVYAYAHIHIYVTRCGT
eukprot:1385246-Amorphochlora_amoeboformis.AAC.1